MNHPITDYFINSSRNSLTLYNIDPSFEESEFNGLQLLLSRGVRYLELEVWVLISKLIRKTN